MLPSSKLPGMKPRAVFCFICGQGYGTSSIMIHVKACQKKWEAQQQTLPVEKRRKCPQPPKEFAKLMGGDRVTGNDIDLMNDAGYNEYKEVGLNRCKNCNRTFNDTAFKKHGNICTSDKPLNPLPSKKKEVEEEEESEYIPVQNKIKELPKKIADLKNGGFAKDTSSNLIKVKKQESIQDIKIKIGTKTDTKTDTKIASKVQKYDLSGASTSDISRPQNLRKETIGLVDKKPVKTTKIDDIKNEPLVKKKDPFSANSFDNLMEKPLTKNVNGIGKTKANGPSGNDRALMMAEKVMADLDLVPCAKCGRKFVSDRVAKHQKACKVNSKPKKVKMFHKPITENEKKKMNKYKTSKWKQQHQELIDQIAYIKQMGVVEKNGGNIRDMPPPPRSKNDNLLACPYCNRKFNPESHEKHVNICKNVVNKPKAVPKNLPEPKFKGETNTLKGKTTQIQKKY